MHTQAVQAERRDVVPLQLRSERAWVQRPYRHAYSTPRAYCQRRVASASSDAPHTPHLPPPQRPTCPCSARVVHIVEIPHPATQGHAHPSPRRLAVNGRPPRAVPPWRGHLARLRCRRAAWTAACAGLRACESRRSAAPLLVAHHAARPRKESLGAAGGVRPRYQKGQLGRARPRPVDPTCGGCCGTLRSPPPKSSLTVDISRQMSASERGAWVSRAWFNLNGTQFRAPRAAPTSCSRSAGGDNIFCTARTALTTARRPDIRRVTLNHIPDERDREGPHTHADTRRPTPPGLYTCEYDCSSDTG